MSIVARRLVTRRESGDRGKLNVEHRKYENGLARFQQIHITGLESSP